MKLSGKSHVHKAIYHSVTYNSKKIGISSDIQLLQCGSVTQETSSQRNIMQPLKMMVIGLTGALGHSFIFMTVVYFGPLTCSMITTTRKFFTILASVILFANPISPMRWVGTVLVFLGLGLDAKFGKRSQEDIPLGRERLPPLQEYLSYFLEQ